MSHLSLTSVDVLALSNAIPINASKAAEIAAHIKAELENEIEALVNERIHEALDGFVGGYGPVTADPSNPKCIACGEPTLDSRGIYCGECGNVA